jgi:hypothetical protein
MSGNARGKLKEEMEGIHRNLDWVRIHSQKAKLLLGETHAELHTYFDTLIEEMTILDEGAAKIYGTL